MASTRRPDLVVGVGGYASGPAVLAASTLRRLDDDPRAEPLPRRDQPLAGAAGRRRLRALPTAAADRIGGRRFVTGNPVRRGDRRRLGETPRQPSEDRRPRLLVFGGSRGARSVNRAMIAAMPALLAALAPPPRVCAPDRQATTSRRCARRSTPARRPGLRGAARSSTTCLQRLAWADLVLARAGATTISELAAAGTAGGAGALPPRRRRPSTAQRRGAGRRRRRPGAARRRRRRPSCPTLLEELLGDVGGSRLRMGAGRPRASARTDATRKPSPNLADRLLAGEPLPAEEVRACFVKRDNSTSWASAVRA